MSTSFKQVYTIGHSDRAIEKFLELLKAYGVTLVVDVRRFPSSRRAPWFNRSALEKYLNTIGVEYAWLGESLGGYRSGGYREYMKTRSYEEGVEKLIELINKCKGSIAIMCSEKQWFKCHRRFISSTICLKGIRVLHIIDEGVLYEHKC
ncbi:MAG: DUF488 family protein [Desulfurococcaceae archaeon]|nr:DUF488 family protein [Sulfolobales archaeon]MDW8169543.1 DUF488 family protein [Desulfurococcaceae archaeon]